MSDLGEKLGLLIRFHFDKVYIVHSKIVNQNQYIFFQGKKDVFRVADFPNLPIEDYVLPDWLNNCEVYNNLKYESPFWKILNEKIEMPFIWGNGHFDEILTDESLYTRFQEALISNQVIFDTLPHRHKILNKLNSEDWLEDPILAGYLFSFEKIFNRLRNLLIYAESF